MKRRSTAIFVALILLAGNGVSGADAAPLEAGFARRSLVTQFSWISLAGYGGRALLPATGVHDETYVKVMVLRTPDEAVAIVTFDLIGVQRSLLTGVEAQPFPARVELDFDHILYTASHTHAGYGRLAQRTGAWGLDSLFLLAVGFFHQGFFDETVGRVHEAIVEAWDDLEPAMLGAGSGVVKGLSRNRGRKRGPTDPELGVIKVTDREGALRGLLVNFTAHPILLGIDNFKLSAGYPGSMQRALEELHPGITALFINGAEGDQSIRVSKRNHPDDWSRMEHAGQRLARNVDRIQQAIEVREDVPIAMNQLEVEMPVPETRWLRWKRTGAPDTSIVSQVVLGDTLLLGYPGEPCVQIGLDHKQRAKRLGFRQVFAVGLAQDHLGYFVHESDYAPGRSDSHDYEKQYNFYGPKIGDFFGEVHFERLDPRPLAPRSTEAAN